MMKRIIGIILVLVFVMGVFGCSKSEPKSDPVQSTQETVVESSSDQSTQETTVEPPSDQLTLDKVVELSFKGEELTWEDFKQYRGIECGSGLCIVQFDIDDDYELVIGGASATGSPMYINLVRKDSEDESGFIDIRTEDVQEFISK